jgi:alkylation response protein AidB-like acyl-CoA dehydrogenase
MTAALEQERAFRGPYDLTEEQDLFRKTVHEFGVREIVPIARELDEKEEYPRATVARMAELGLCVSRSCASVPKPRNGASYRHWLRASTSARTA